jgi:hypothetical protein
MSSVPEPEGRDRDLLEIGAWASLAAGLLFFGGCNLTDIIGRLYMEMWSKVLVVEDHALIALSIAEMGHGNGVNR